MKYQLLLDVENVMLILNKISILAGLLDKQLQFLFQLLKKVSYSAGEIIFEEGQAKELSKELKKCRIRFKV